MIDMAQSEEATLQGCHCCNKELRSESVKEKLSRRRNCNGKRSSPALIPVSNLE